MKRTLSLVGTVVIGLVFGADAFAQKAARCTDLSLEMSVEATGAMAGDGKGLYKNGVDGVYNAVINVCTKSYNATIGLVNSKRSLTMTFPPVTAGTPHPGWVDVIGEPDSSPSSIVTKPYFTVNDLLYGQRNSVGSFTTWMVIGFIKGLVDKADYQLRFRNVAADAQGTVNAPESGTVLVTVDPGGDNATGCAAGAVRRSWYVTTVSADPSIGTLYDMTKWEYYGSYDMPIRLKFTTKDCVNWTTFAY